MSVTLTGAVERAALGVWLGALLAIGFGTGAVLHVEGRTATDRALLAAAVAWPAELEDEGGVDVRPVRPGELPRAWVADARRGPIYRTTEERRSLVVAVQGDEGDEEEERDPLLLLASAPRATLARTTGPFAVGFAGVAGLVTVAGAVALRRRLAGAVAPLAVASRRVSRVVGAGAGARVDEGGPAEIRELLVAVNALLERLERAFRAQGSFTAQAAHELRTPVAGLIGELEVAARRPRTPEEAAEAIRLALGSAHRLSELVDGLLLLARVDAGQAEQGRTSEHAGHLATLAAARERAAIEAAGGTLATLIRADPEVEVHEALWVAGIANLLRNAAVHAPGAPVRLEVDEADGVVRFAVEDGGPGIPADAFDRPARGAGLGVGLPLAREIARRHGGDCVLEGAARVVLTVPRHDVPDAPP